MDKQYLKNERQKIEKPLKKPKKKSINQIFIIKPQAKSVKKITKRPY